MKNIFSFIPRFGVAASLICFFYTTAQAQLSVSTALTPTQLVQTVLVGTGVTVSNVTYTGAAGALGKFQTGATPTNLGFGSGVIMSSGSVNSTPAIGSGVWNFASTDNGTGTDANLQTLTADIVQDAAILQFDFVPLSDTIKFRYVFASEEYPEFVNSSVNDVFGFFVSGPNPAGGSYANRNIALIPGTTQAVSIDNINLGTYPQYYIDNEGINGTSIVYDGFTKVFTAWCVVVPCLQYHIKLAIGDAGDGIYDSGVFLEANSFSSTAVNITQYPSVPAVGNDGIEGCNDITVEFTLPTPQTNPYPVSYAIGGTATNGVDYATIPNAILIPAGQTTASILIQPLNDGIAEGNETIVLTVQTSICGSTQDLVLTIKDNTPLVLQTTNDTLISCGNSVTLSALASGGIQPYIYTWDGGLGSGTSITVAPTTDTYYLITVRDICTNSVSDSIKVMPEPGVTDAGPDVTICQGQSTILSGIGGPGYQWSNGGTTASITVQPNNSTVYYLTTTSACPGFDSVTVFVNPTPPVLATADTSLITMGESVQLSASGAQSYVWSSTPPDPSLAGQQQLAQPTLMPSTTTTYTVVGVDANGCTASSKVTVTVIPVLPIAAFSGSPLEGCAPLSVQFQDHSLKVAPDATYWWDFGNGSYSMLQNPVGYYPTHGTFDVTLIVTNPGNLADTLTLPGYVRVFPTPQAAFVTTPDLAPTILNPTIGFFDRTLPEATVWEWDFGDGLGSIMQNDFHTYSDTGNYSVTLSVANDFGCSDTVNGSVRIRPDSWIWLPNAFTPNGDGKNDVFLIQGDGMLEGSFLMRIFNRWGEEVFFSIDPNYAWDGTYNGHMAPLGSYVYRLEFHDLEYHLHEYTGTVTLFR